MKGRGLYANQIVIQRKQLTPDGEGGFAEAWLNGQFRMARVSRMKYQRNDEGFQVGNNYTYLIKVDAKDFDVVLSDRIVYNGRTLKIIAIENLSERSIELEIIATERTV